MSSDVSFKSIGCRLDVEFPLTACRVYDALQCDSKGLT